MKERLLFCLALACFATQPASAGDVSAELAAKPASMATRAAQDAQRKRMLTDDGRDAEFAARGFIATRADPIVRDPDGKPVVDLNAYAWIEGLAPPSVNPSLWRHMQILKRHGLFKLADGVWQLLFAAADIVCRPGDHVMDRRAAHGVSVRWQPLAP